MLNRDSILQAQDFKTVDVDVPEWGGSLRLRMLSAAERFAVNDAATVDGKFDPTKFQTTLIEFTAVDETGVKLFQPGDAAALAGKSATAVGRVFEAASALNALNAGAVEIAEKNS
jgi:hypothetical protein